MDLDLLVLDHEEDIFKQRVEDYQRIPTNKDVLLWKRLQGSGYDEGTKGLVLDPLMTPRSFSILVKDAYDNINEVDKDVYARPLTYLYNFELQRLKRCELAEKTTYAIRSIDHLSPNLPVVLYWC